MILVESGAGDDPEGPRDRLSFRCELHVEESGSDWAGSVARAAAAVRATHPDERDLFGWSCSNRTGHRVVSLETAVREDLSRVCASMRTRTVSEIVVHAAIVVESEDWASGRDEVEAAARDALRDLFGRDAVALAASSPGDGIVLASSAVETCVLLARKRV